MSSDPGKLETEQPKKRGFLAKIGGATAGFFGGLLIPPFLAAASYAVGAAKHGTKGDESPPMKAINIVGGFVIGGIGGFVVGTLGGIFVEPWKGIYAGWTKGVEGLKKEAKEAAEDNYDLGNLVTKPSEEEKNRETATTEQRLSTENPSTTPNNNAGTQRLSAALSNVNKDFQQDQVSPSGQTKNPAMLTQQHNQISENAHSTSSQPKQSFTATATQPIPLEPAVVDKINEMQGVKKHGQLSVTNDVPTFTGSNPIAALKACDNKELLGAEYHLQLPASKTLDDAKKEIAEARNGKPEIKITTCNVGGKTYDVKPNPNSKEVELSEQKAPPLPRSHAPS